MSVCAEDATQRGEVCSIANHPTCSELRAPTLAQGDRGDSCVTRGSAAPLTRRRSSGPTGAGERSRGKAMTASAALGVIAESPRQSPASRRAQTRMRSSGVDAALQSGARFRPGVGSQPSRTLGLRNVTGRCSASISALLPPTASRRARSGSHPSAPGCRSMMSIYSPTPARGGCAPAWQRPTGSDHRPVPVLPDRWTGAVGDHRWRADVREQRSAGRSALVPRARAGDRSARAHPAPRADRDGSGRARSAERARRRPVAADSLPTTLPVTSSRLRRRRYGRRSSCGLETIVRRGAPSCVSRPLWAGST